MRPSSGTSPEAISDLQRKLAEGLAKIDPHHRLLGRPVTYRVIDGKMLEITYRDLAGIADAELLGWNRIVGQDCPCSLSPQTAERDGVSSGLPPNQLVACCGARG